MTGNMTNRKGLDRKEAADSHITLKTNKLTNKRIQNEQENHQTRSN